MWIVALVILILAGMLWASSGTVGKSVTVGGFIMSGTSVLSDNIATSVAPSVIVAQPATLTTRASNTGGTLTMTNSLHGITTGQRIDLYWGTGPTQFAYAALVGTVSGTTVPFTLAAGNSLPIATTAITVGIATAASLVVTGNNLTLLAMATPVQGLFVFYDGTNNDYAVMLNAGAVKEWYQNSSTVNPLATYSITQVYVSHSDTLAAHTMQVAALSH